MEVLREWLEPASSSKTGESIDFAFKKVLEEYALPAGSLPVERLTTIDELHEPTEIFGHLPGDKRGLFWEYVYAGVLKGLAISYSCGESWQWQYLVRQLAASRQQTADSSGACSVCLAPQNSALQQ
jgi:hypothetical protein